MVDIIGQVSPVDSIDGDEVTLTGDQNQEQIKVVHNFADVQNIRQSITSLRGLSDVGNESRQRKVEGDTDDYLSQKRKLTLELISHNIYLRKLQALKLEKELGIVRSEYTQELEVTKEIKTENTCEMDFEY